MNRRLMLASAPLAFALAFVSVGSHSVDAQEAASLRLATLDRVAGPWERPLSAWRTQIARDTQGAMRLDYDERGGNALARLESGEVDGAFLSVISLGDIDPALLVLNAPGVITDYETLDRVRRRMNNHFAQILDAKGFKLLGWFDLGRIRFFATQPILEPSTLRSMHPWTLPQDRVFSEFLRVVGATPVPLPIDDVKDAIPHQVNVVPGSALSAYGLEWYPRLPYVSEQARGVVVGMTVVRKSKFEALSPQQQQVLTGTAGRVHEILRNRMRQQDETLLRTILSRQGSHTFDMSAHSAEWQAAAEQARTHLAGHVYPADLAHTVVRAATP